MSEIRINSRYLLAVGLGLACLFFAVPALKGALDPSPAPVPEDVGLALALRPGPQTVQRTPRMEAKWGGSPLRSGRSARRSTVERSPDSGLADPGEPGHPVAPEPPERVPLPAPAQTPSPSSPAEAPPSTQAPAEGPPPQRPQRPPGHVAPARHLPSGPPPDGSEEFAPR